MQVRAIETGGQLEEAKSEHLRWKEYNTELLKHLFTTDELAEEYIAFYGLAMSYRTLREDIAGYRKDVGDGLRRLESIVDRLELYPESRPNTTSEPGRKARPLDNNRVFVVHGHDDAARETLARFLQRLGLDPVILHEKATGGRTIIEKLERYSDVSFAVVLLTPDDLGAEKQEAADLKPRARQNVIMELGFFLGTLGRHHVCALYKGPLDLPSDYIGVGYVHMDDGAGWKLELARELKEAGFAIDMNRAL